jgi:hypothetical protein
MITEADIDKIIEKANRKTAEINKQLDSLTIEGRFNINNVSITGNDEE